jgi:aspartyl-tRNA(Asn)/glutamyl-tRNA(Gln) amidotransferase subunit A
MIKKTELPSQSIETLHQLFEAGIFEPEDLLDGILDNIRRYDPKIHSYLYLDSENSLRTAARNASNAINQGNDSPLRGIPIAVKDNTYLAGMPCTGGSKFLSSAEPCSSDAHAIAKLRDSGAIFLGKTNLDEMAAFGISTNNPHFGRTFNPWDLNRIPGGSSGGSAAAVASCEAVAATGSDTGGSVRIPASFCNLVGFKPTFGRIGRSGTITMSWSLDSLGVMTRYVRDAALLASIMSGSDAFDAATIAVPAVEKYEFASNPDLSKIKIGVLENPICSFDKDVQRVFDESVSVLAGLGAAIQSVKLPLLEEITPAIFAIALPETASFHEDWLRSSPELYGSVLRSYVELGHGILATQYLKAQRMKTMITREISKKLREFDVIVTPTAPSIAPVLDQETIKIGEKDYPAFKIITENTYPMNFLGIPAMTIPNGFSMGMPTGMQIISSHWNESAILTVGDAYQQVTDHHKKIAVLD